MNRYIIPLLYCIGGLLNSGCTYEDFDPERWAVEPTLELSESGLVFTAAINQGVIGITTNYQSFSTACDDSWCKIDENHDKSQITISVSPNMKAEQRKTTVNVTVRRGSKELTKALSVVQMGGYWDVIDQFSVYWSSDVTDTQKETIGEILKEMVFVKGGEFVMGYNGQTRHKVTLSNFYINRFEVTQKQWNTIFGINNSTFKGADLPVDNISWEDGLNFVSILTRLTGLNFNMPTEAQWEYAARGGVFSMGYVYAGSNDYEDVMEYKGALNPSDPSITTYRGGQFCPNELGLYDMNGNVSEMCSDWYGEFDLADQFDPVGPSSGEYHVQRGGNISVSPLICQIKYRNICPVNHPMALTGIRLCVRP